MTSTNCHIGETRMSDIQPGDMAMVVKIHCAAHERYTGLICTVERLEVAFAYECSGCHQVLHELDGQMLVYGMGKRAGFYPGAWMKRIAPLADLEREERDEKITA